MQNEEHPSSAYDYSLAPYRENLYVFTTINCIRYEVEFRPTFYLFDDEPLLSEEAFELIIGVTGDSKNVPFDSLTGITIAAIISNFYERSPLTTTLFICDDSDRRELARHRRFGSWFTTYNPSKFSKLDFEWQDKASRIFYVSVIFLATNPFAGYIQQHFEKLANAFRQDK